MPSQPRSSGATRRQFLQTLAAGTALATLPLRAADKPRIKLGYDNFAVRAMGWKADALIEYATTLKIDSLFISDLDALESFEPAYLTRIRKKATDAGLQLHLGTWSICSSSKTFKPKWGTADQHLALGMKLAKQLGSPVLRVILGNKDDRKTAGGIEAHIENVVKTCKAARSMAMDLGVKIAVENHAGDLHSSELVQLIEAAGRDFVGANLDSGNAVWALEHPQDNLEALGPYALTTSLRDSALWETEDGANLQWAAMGEGYVDLKKYFARYAELCPQVPVHIETISGFILPIPFYKEEFWASYRHLRAEPFARFVRWAKKNKPFTTVKNATGKDAKETEQLAQKGELERSLQYCRTTLGLGGA